MKTLSTHILLFFLLVSFQIMASPGGELKKYHKAVKRGDHYYKALYFVDAIEEYRKALSYHEAIDQDLLAYPSLQIANSFYHLNRYHDALFYYRRVERYDVMSEKEKRRYFQTLLTNKEYDKAAEIANQIEEGMDSLHVHKLAKIKIDTNSYEIENHWANSSFDEFSPAYYRGGIIFSSNREREGVRQKTFKWDDSFFLDLYYSAMDSGQYAKSYPFSTAINSPYHEGAVALSGDEQTIVFTRNNFTNGKKKASEEGVNMLKLYSSKRNDENTGWEKPKEFWFNNDNYSVGHPTLSSDGTVMYFASDMPGSVGEADIFVTYLENGQWSKPISLGDQLNTVEDELFPFLYQDSVLFFASKGHVGLGGLDIYKVNLNACEWEIENLGQPINSPYDDFGLIQKEHSGFFSSNRPEGKGGDDVYKFFYEEDIPQYVIAVRVIDIKTKEPIANASVTVRLESESVPVSISNENGNSYFQSPLGMNYAADAFHPDYFASELYFEFEEVPEGDTLFVDLPMTKIEIERPIVLKNVYYELDKADITLEAAIELDRLVWVLKKNPEITIELSSHTDSRGAADYNMDLSQRRAESAVNYIIQSGVASSRITAKGYGETRPVNDCFDGVECSENAHLLNRRTEFTIISNGMIAEN